MNKYNLTEKEVEDILELLFKSNEYNYMKGIVYKEHLTGHEFAKKTLEKYKDNIDDCPRWVKQLSNPDYLNIAPKEVIEHLLVYVSSYRHYYETGYFTIENGEDGIEYSIPFPGKIYPITKEEFRKIVNHTVRALEYMSHHIQGYSYKNDTERFCLVIEYLEEAIRRIQENKSNEYEIEYDRRAVEAEYGLEEGELDDVSIREAEDIVDEEEGALDRFIIDDEGTGEVEEDE